MGKMKKSIAILMGLLVSIVALAMTVPSIYDYTVKDIDGNEKAMKDYKGKVLLVVNVASKCGFTEQYKNLQKLYETNKSSNFEILGFPCNQFGEQEPGTEAEIKEFCSTKFNVTFPMFSKIDVNGEKTADIYTFLKKQGPVEEPVENEQLHRMYNLMEEKISPRVVGSEDIRWNFTKFLIDQNGHVVKRFEPTATFVSIQKEIDKLLGK